ncbi:MAG: T9SS type A sorting domain-containing protein [Lacibacter sp.]
MRKLLLFCLIISSLSVTAQWNSDISVNNQICTSTGDQYSPAITSDGAGGAIIVWADNRSGNYDIYAQRINSTGSVLWQANGVLICNASGDQFFPVIISDGAGGAIISWTDYRNDVGYTNTDIFSQKINSSGVVQWTANGIPVCNNNTNQRSVQMSLFGTGGAVFVWSDDRNGSTNSDIYAQSVDANGNFLWTANGIAVNTASGYQLSPTILTAGNVVTITWLHNSGSTYSIYAQKLDASGNLQWTTNGIAVCVASGFRGTNRIITDGADGSIISWEDSRSGNADIYAQKLNASGTAQWTSNGVVVSNAYSSQSQPEIIEDGNGGAILFWLDYRNATDFSVRDLYAQKINSSGTAQWTNNGLAICTATGHQQGYKIVSDGLSGAYFTWYDLRTGTSDIYLQRVSAGGTTLLNADGQLIGSATNTQEFPVIVSDQANGAIVAWTDKRSGENDIYATRFLNNTTTSVRNISYEKTVALFPNPVQAGQQLYLNNAASLIGFYGIDGKKIPVTILQSSANLQIIQLPDVPKGIYILETRSRNNKTEMIKVSVN